MPDTLDEKITQVKNQLEITSNTITNIIQYDILIRQEISNYLHALERHQKKLNTSLETLLKAQGIVTHDDTQSYKLWRDKVLMRDRFTCQRCASTEDLTVHHIISKRNCNDFQWDPSNGITLCRDCHNEWNDLYEPLNMGTTIFLKWLQNRLN